MAFRIFHEPSEGIVQHTAASKTLAETPLLRQYIGMVSEEIWPAATKVCSPTIRPNSNQTNNRQTVEAWTKWPGSEEPNNTVSFICSIFTVLN